MGNFNFSTLDLKKDESSRYQIIQTGNWLRTELTTVASVEVLSPGVGVEGGLGAGGLGAGGLGAGDGLGAGGLGAGDGLGAGGATGTASASAGAGAPTRLGPVEGSGWLDAESSDEVDDDSQASSSSALWSLFGKTHG